MIKIRLWVLALLFLVAACAGPSAEITLTPALPTAAAEATYTATPVPVARATNTPAPTDTPAPTPSPTPPTIKLVLWENLPPAQAQQLAEEINAFYAVAPNTLIEVQHYDDPQTLGAAIAAGRVDYDIVLGAAPLIGALQLAGNLQPMSDFFPPSFLDGFSGVTLAGATRNGETWALPDTAGFHLLLFYNPDLIQTPPASTDELVQLAQSLSGGGRQGVVVNSFDPLWVLPWWGDYADRGGGIDIERLSDALALHRDLHGANGAALDYGDMRDLFTAGKAAMMIDGEWAIGELTAIDEPFSWRVATLPVVTESGVPALPLVAGRYWGLGKQTTGLSAERGAAFLTFITRTERQLAWTEKFGLLPTRRDALNAPQILADPVLRADAQQMQAGLGMALGDDANVLLDAMRDPLRQLLYDALTPEDAARQIERNLQ